nr:N-acetyltransferase [Kribbella shirazensis]
MRNPTLVQCAAVSDVLANLHTTPAEVNISTTPSAAWTDCWWSIDGRGADTRAAAEQILARGKALYASVPDGPRVKAIGRLALVDDTAGLYCLAVDERFRRQGLASAIIHGLLQAATSRWVWLSVLEDNTAARTLYDRLGFQTVSRYHYRVKE